ncbi:MAG: hypothetical protein ACXVYB_14955 [Arthrobacter sp.]
MQTPGHPDPREIMNPDTRGAGGAVAGLVFSVLVFGSMLLTLPVSTIAALFTRPDTGTGRLQWVAIAVFWSLPVLFGLLSVILCVRAVIRFPPRTDAWTAGVVGLSILGLQALYIITLMVLHGSVRIIW